MQSLLSADTILVHSPAISLQQRESSSISKPQQTFDCTSTALAMATTELSDLRTLIGPAIAPTASLKVDTSFSRVTMVAPYHCSLGSKTSSPYQHSKPNISPAPKPPEKRDGWYNCRETFTALRATHPHYHSTVTIRVPSHITTGVIKARMKHIDVCYHNSRDLHARKIVDYS